MTAVTATTRSPEENWFEGGGVSSFSSWTMGDIAPNAVRATTAIGGRITTFEGEDASEVFADLTDSKGAARTTQANSLGVYRFDDILVGETYVINIRAKGYRFARGSFT